MSPKKILIKKIMDPKKCESEKNFWSKTIGIWKNLCQKIFFGSNIFFVFHQFFFHRKAYISNMSLLLGLNPFKKFSVGGWWVVVKKHLEFRFCPYLGLRLEAWTKLNNFSLEFKDGDRYEFLVAKQLINTAVYVCVCVPNFSMMILDNWSNISQRKWNKIKKWKKIK